MPRLWGGGYPLVNTKTGRKKEGNVEYCKNCTFRMGSECRRYPPQHTITEVETYHFLEDGHRIEEKAREHLFKFPTIEQSNWCGEWKKKEEKIAG